MSKYKIGFISTVFLVFGSVSVMAQVPTPMQPGMPQRYVVPLSPPAFVTTPAPVTAPAVPAPATAPVATSAAAPAEALAEEVETPPDPCEAYMASYAVYASCQDRIQKIQRMKEAKQRRIDVRKAKAAQKAEAVEAAKNKEPVVDRSVQVPRLRTQRTYPVYVPAESGAP